MARRGPEVSKLNCIQAWLSKNAYILSITLFQINVWKLLAHSTLLGGLYALF